MDVSNGGNNGTPANVVQGVAGKVHTAYGFNWVNPSVDMGAYTNLAINIGSASCWVYISSLRANDGTIFEKGDMSNQLYGYGMYYGGGNLVFETANTTKHTNYYANTGVTLHASLWYHVVCTWNGTSVVTYLNGTKTLSAAEGTPVTFNNYDFALGKNPHTNTAGFPGTIDEVGVWSRVLSPGKVTALNNSGAGVAYPFTGVTVPITYAPSAPLVTNNINTTVTAYPNPYSSIVHFNLKTAAAGRGSLVMNDVQGRRVATVFEGDLVAGDDRTVQYNFGVIPRQPLIYIFTIEDQIIYRKLVPGGS
jgi:hypothetical protein